MDILFLTNKPPYPLVDGGCIATYNLVDAFAKVGNNVKVLSFSTEKHPGDIDTISEVETKSLTFDFVQVSTALSLTSALKNFLFSKLPYNAERFISKEYENALIKELKKNSYDIVQLEGLYLCPYIETVKKYSGAKVVLRSHNIEAEIWKRTASNESNKIKKRYLKSLYKRISSFEKQFVNQYDLLVPITERDNETFSRLKNKKPSMVAPSGYDFNKWRAYDGEDDLPNLAHLGALDWLPNQEGILWFLENVWTNLVGVYPKLVFKIAGRNAPDSFVSKVLNYSGVEYIGEVPDAVTFINNAGIMIVPLLSGGGMRVKIVEGMALGKTIVTTSIGAEGISVTSGENIVIADSNEKFFAELCKLIEDEDCCRSIGISAKSFIERKYDNAEIASSLLQFYEEHL